MTKKGILVASFGTTAAETREKTIGAIEGEVAAAYPDWVVRRAFTSGIIREKLARVGVQVDSVPQALDKMAREGFEEVLVLPTHLLHGVEYDRLTLESGPWVEKFQTLSLAPPLLDSTQDLFCLARGVLAEHPGLQPNQALVLLGHGTRHHGDFAYGALDRVLADLGAQNVLVGTVEGYPGLAELLPRLKVLHPTEIILRPLMVVAGEHALTDMAGAGADSWKSRLEGEGWPVRCALEGLGQVAAVRKMYLRLPGTPAGTREE